ncbi:MAG: type II toxin-antitoxin system ParD family antitoxin [Chromatiaceae bacterium]|nr:type II toxin-antitoxin system ParD family antitoxin [Chromatiaceae bacterium]MCF7994649.1 type II toxin-antitoxin system ParD family antitoxin [Chromatiaceae bacterium]MCF8017388.1 type II toxin-antitoxin system ParD family antitoxin [Chromatiaceae bacterium]
MARTQTITLGDHWSEFVAGLVESGRYSTVSEVVRDSLRLLQEREAASSLEALRQALIEGENSGAPRPLAMDVIKRRARQEAGLSADA